MMKFWNQKLLSYLNMIWSQFFSFGMRCSKERKNSRDQNLGGVEYLNGTVHYNALESFWTADPAVLPKSASLSPSQKSILQKKETLYLSLCKAPDVPITKIIWNCQLPLKIKIFTWQLLKGRLLMTHKYRGCIVVLSINKSVKPNEEQNVLTSGFDQSFTANTSKRVFRGIW
jgi:hypothetical protein